MSTRIRAISGILQDEETGSEIRERNHRDPVRTENLMAGEPSLFLVQRRLHHRSERTKRFMAWDTGGGGRCRDRRRGVL